MISCVYKTIDLLISLKVSEKVNFYLAFKSMDKKNISEKVFSNPLLGNRYLLPLIHLIINFLNISLRDIFP